MPPAMDSINRRDERPARDAGDPEPPAVSLEDILGSVARFVRFGVTFIGLGVLLLGVVLAAWLFFEVMECARGPERLQASITKWAEVLGGDALNLPNPNGPPLPLGKLMAAGVLGGVALVLGFLALGIASCGARIISWTVDDRKAVKAVLDYAWQHREKEHS